MNFKGRYFTMNGTVVAIHSTNDGSNQWGHILRMEASYKDDTLFEWNKEGDCVKISDELSDINKVSIMKIDTNRASIMKYDISHRVSPQSYEANIECVDYCEECRKERASELSKKTT